MNTSTLTWIDAPCGDVIATAKALDGLGAKELWPGRRESYRDAVALGENPTVRRWFGPERIPDLIKGKWYLSSCGLVRRRIEAAHGVDSDSHYAPYKDGSAMAVCENFARKCGAWLTPDKWDSLAIGDAIWRANGQHVCTVIDFDATSVTTLDGGQDGGLGEGTEIRTVKRTVRRTPGRVVLVSSSGREFVVRGISCMSSLALGRPSQIAQRGVE